MAGGSLAPAVIVQNSILEPESTDYGAIIPYDDSCHLVKTANDLGCLNLQKLPKLAKIV